MRVCVCRYCVRRVVRMVHDDDGRRDKRRWRIGRPKRRVGSLPGNAKLAKITTEAGRRAVGSRRRVQKLSEEGVEKKKKKKGLVVHYDQYGYISRGGWEEYLPYYHPTPPTLGSAAGSD